VRGRAQRVRPEGREVASRPRACKAALQAACHRAVYERGREGVQHSASFSCTGGLSQSCVGTRVNLGSGIFTRLLVKAGRSCIAERLNV